MDISKYIVKKGMTILQAMSVMDKNGKRIAFYLSDKNELIGVITDGDVRRFILNGGDLSQPVEVIVNYEPIKILKSEDVNYQKVMLEKQITALPIVNNQNILEKIEFLYSNDKTEKNRGLKNVPVVIMAGGKGTRLQPYTNILPKPLIPIGEETITERIIHNFEKYGAEKYYMIVNYKKNLIKAYFDEQKSSPEFVEEESFLGTGGGLKLLKNEIRETFFLTNCDILLEADLTDIFQYHNKERNLITMICAKKKETLPYGSVILGDNGCVRQLEEKPSRIYNVNTGIYVLDPVVIDMIPENTFIHITDVINILIEKGERVGCYLVEDDQWLDMGQFDELYNMKKSLDII